MLWFSIWRFKPSEWHWPLHVVLNGTKCPFSKKLRPRSSGNNSYDGTFEFIFFKTKLIFLCETSYWSPKALCLKTSSVKRFYSRPFLGMEYEYLHCRVIMMRFGDCHIKIPEFPDFLLLLYVHHFGAISAIFAAGDMFTLPILDLASQTTSVLIVCSAVCSGADQRKHQSSASLTFEREFTGEFYAQRASDAEIDDVIMDKIFSSVVVTNRLFNMCRDGISTVRSTVCSDAHHRKYQIPMSQWPVWGESTGDWWKIFSFDKVIMMLFALMALCDGFWAVISLSCLPG